VGIVCFFKAISFGKEKKQQRKVIKTQVIL